MGNLNWLTAHTRLARPFMARLYQSNTINVHDKYVEHALNSTLTVAVAPAAVTRGIAPFLGLPPTAPYLYVDAAKSTGIACVVYIGQHSSWSHRTLVPPQYAHSQQLCELFGYLFALHFLLRENIPEAILVGDNNGGLQTLYTLRTPSRNHRKLHLSQRVSRAIAKLKALVHIRWCSTGTMLADCGSRNFVEPIGVRSSYSDALHARGCRYIHTDPDPAFYLVPRFRLRSASRF